MGLKDKPFKRFTITAALPYANGPLHIGHLAGAYLPSDIFVRFLRLQGKDSIFICGTDEHGAAITVKARELGITPQQLVDKYHQQMAETFRDFNISFDIFSRTTKPVHHETAQEFFRKFYDEGKLVEKTTEQLYDPEANMFLADRFVKGTCPKCGFPEAYGDQCESCGTSLNATDLINPKSAVTGATPVMKETKHWFLPLDQYQQKLEKYILEDHKEWKSNVYGQCKSWLQDGLQPRAITRDLDWGVKVAVEGAEGKVLYVWFDAPIGYISATRELADEKGFNWEPWWKDNETALIHFIGKDNIVFHCIIFPAILMGHGGYILPENVPANEFLNLEGEKNSTSRNWSVLLHEYVEDFKGKTDNLRYVLTATMPETKDYNFTWEEFRKRNNNELVANFSNFIHRSLTLTHKNCQGKIPKRHVLKDRDKELLDELKQISGRISDALWNFRFKDALNEMMNLSRAGNVYLGDTEPWHLIKNNETDRAETVLNLCLHTCAMLAVAAEPFIPEAAHRLREMLGTGNVKWDDLQRDEILTEGSDIGTPEILFGKIEEQEVVAQLEKLRKNKEKKEKAKMESVNIAPMKEEITFDDFQKMDIRIGKILTAEKVEKADKLLKFKVDTGVDQRTIVSGVAQHFEPEAMVGKQVLVLANLAPRKIRGVESQGMILFAEDSEGKLHVVTPESLIRNGSVVA